MTILWHLDPFAMHSWSHGANSGFFLLLGQEGEQDAAAPLPQQKQDAPSSQAPAAAPGGQQQQQGGEVSTATAKLVAEVVASPIFYLVAGGLGWCAALANIFSVCCAHP